MITGVAAFFRPLWIAVVVCVPFYLFALTILPVYDSVFPWITAVERLKADYPDQKRLCFGIGYNLQENGASIVEEYQRSYLLFPSFLTSHQGVTIVQRTVDGGIELDVISSSTSIILAALYYAGCAFFTWKVSFPWFIRLFSINNKTDNAM